MNLLNTLYDTLPSYLQEEAKKTYDKECSYAGLSMDERIDICAQVFTWMKIFPSYKAMNAFLDGEDFFISQRKLYEDLQRIEPQKRQYASHVARTYAGLRTLSAEDENKIIAAQREKIYRMHIYSSQNTVAGDLNIGSVSLNVSTLAVADFSLTGLYDLPPIFEGILEACITDPEYEKINAFAKQFSMQERVNLCEMAYKIGREFKTPVEVTNFIISDRDEMVKIIPDIKELRQDREMFVMIAAQYYVKELNKQKTLGEKVLAYFGLQDHKTAMRLPHQKGPASYVDSAHIQQADPVWIARNRWLQVNDAVPANERK